MAVFICRMCGGRLTPLNKTATCKCDFCGIVQSVPLLDGEDKAEMCAAAERLRREYRYDKAIELYEELIRLSPTDADLYWALALCRCGTEYVSRGGSLVPALNRTTARSLLSDEDYKTALKYAGGEQRAVMERQAAEIDAVRRRIVELSRGAEDYDVYINCRESDENGRRTSDSLIAADICARLSAEGLRVFFPHVCLEDKAVADWEPYIFSALNSAAVMIVAGTSADSFEDIWVRNAWSRFLAFTANDSRRRIIPAFRDMEANELPKELAGFQALDMSRLGFETDLAASVGNVLGTRRERNAPAASEPLLRRARLFIEDRDYSGAEQLLSELSESAEGYLLRLLSEYKLTSENELEELKTDFSDSENYRAAMRLGDESFRLKLRERNLTSLYNRCLENLDKARTDIQYRAAASELRALNYRNSAGLADSADKKAAEISAENEIRRREGVYALAEKMLKESDDIIILSSAEKSLRELGDYRSAAELAEECAAKIEDLSEKVPDARLYDRKRIPAKWIAAACGTLAAGIIIGVFAVTIWGKDRVIVGEFSSVEVAAETAEPVRAKTAEELNAEKYEKAAALLEQGGYDDAELIFTALGGYSNSADMAKECKYQKAADLLENGKRQEAKKMFASLGEYSDSSEMVFECDYRSALAIKESGGLEAAESIFALLGEYSDSQEQLNSLRYTMASSALKEGDTAKAEELFLLLCGYSDAATQYCKLVYADAERLIAEGDIPAACERLEPLLDCYNKYKLDKDYWFVGRLAEAAEAYNEGWYLGCIKALRQMEDNPMKSVLNESAWQRRITETKKGDIISFGHYEQGKNLAYDKSIKWEVIDNDGEGAIILMTEYELFEAPFDTENGGSWTGSSLREYLNNEFLYSAFDDEERSYMRYTDFGADIEYEGTESCADMVYIPSYDFALLNRHNFCLQPYKRSEGNTVHSGTTYKPQWVLKGINEAFCFSDFVEDADGNFRFTDYCGIRPVIKLSVK